jgi:uncharacterized protein
MPHAKQSRRLDPRGPLVFETAALGSGSPLRRVYKAPAPPELGVALVRVPERADLELDVELERVTDGVLVTATVAAPLAGECARCLEPFDSAIKVRLAELFTHPVRGAADEDEDGYVLDGDLLDLEPALRDALVLELPLAPLCAEDCPGLCVQCGMRLADMPAGHGHDGHGHDGHGHDRADGAAGAAADGAEPGRQLHHDVLPDGAPVPDEAKEL